MPETTDFDGVYTQTRGKNNALFFTVDKIQNNVSVGSVLVPTSAQDPNIPFYVLGSQNNYFGINVYNLATTGGTVSTDIVVSNSVGTNASGTYTDFGMVGNTNTDANYAVFDQNAGYAYSQSNNMYVSSGTGGTVFLSAGGFSSKSFVGLSVDNNQNIAMGTGAVGSAGTAGFMYLRAGTGAPTGTPQAKTGMVPFYYDVSGNNLYIYNGGWKKNAGGTYA